MTSVTTYRFPFASGRRGFERRRTRRHDMETRRIEVEQWDQQRGCGTPLGSIVDISVEGIRIRTKQPGIRPEQQIRIRLTLPEYAGICPFIDSQSDQPRPTKQWVGWMTITRVRHISRDEIEVAGRLSDMDELDRAMFGLYLSTQPLAA